MVITNPRSRVMRTSEESKASVYIEENGISIIGDKTSFIVADDRGISIKGPISMVNDGMDRRSGGLFVEMPDMIGMIPSTLITPLPKKLPVPPVNGVGKIAQDVAFFMALLV